MKGITPKVGGGGLLAGCTIAARGVKPSIRVFGAEPLGADDAARSKAAGEWLPQTAANTIADGLLTSTGQLTWPIIRDLVERVFTVSDDEIRAAMRLVWERMKLIVEPSGAVSAAVALSAAFKALPEREEGRHRLQRRQREFGQTLLVRWNATNSATPPKAIPTKYAARSPQPNVSPEPSGRTMCSESRQS